MDDQLSTPALEKLREEITQGEWSTPHFALRDSERASVRIKGFITGKPCMCGYVLAEPYMGSVAEVHYNRTPRDDNPPLAEASANARLIALSPQLLSSLLEARETITQLEARLAAQAGETQGETT